jgi:CBS domain containing-hemolysin-like protein
MIVALLLFFLGVALSALFSGTETGFYRVPRVRLRLDALAGDRIAQGLWWLANRPALFVATTLLGNNLANYLVSLSIVMGADAVWPGVPSAELIATLFLSPLVFVYGESLPKQLFFEAPYFLLRRGGPVFLACSIIGLPFSLLFWGLSKLIERLGGQSPPQVKLALARRELQSVLEEGHAEGLLRPAQRQLAQGLFAVANEPAIRFAVPPQRLAHVRLGMTKAEVLRLAKRQQAPELPVEEPLGRRKLIGYVRVAELKLDDSEEIRKVRPLIDIPSHEPHIAALVRLHESGESMGRLLDVAGQVVGIVTAASLSEPLFRGER